MVGVGVNFELSGVKVWRLREINANFELGGWKMRRSREIEGWKVRRMVGWAVCERKRRSLWSSL